MKKQVLSIGVLPAILIAMLFFTPFIISEHLFNGIIITWELWTYTIIACITLYSGLNIALSSKQQYFNINTTDLLLTGFITWCIFRSFNSLDAPFYENHKLQIYAGCIVLYSFTKGLFSRIKGHHEKSSLVYSIIIITLLLSGFIQAIYGLMQLYGFCHSLHGGYSMTGSFYNPAPYAVFLAVIFSIAMGTLLFFIKDKRIKTVSFTIRLKSKPITFQISSILKYFSIATITAILLVIPATMIRSSWLGIISGTGVIIWIALKTKLIKNLTPLSTLSRYLVIAVAILITGASTVFLYKLKEGSSEGRLFIWEVAINNIKEKPVSGQGLGAFESNYNTWQADYFKHHPNEKTSAKGWVAGNVAYCYNEYIEMASEIGIAGLLLFLISIGSLFFPGRKLSEKPSGEDDNLFDYWENPSLVIYAPIISILVMAVFSFPLSVYNIPTLLLFVIFTAIISANTEPVFKKEAINPLPKLARFSLATILITGCLVIGHKQYLKTHTYRNWQKGSFAFEAGRYKEANNIFSLILPELKYDPLFLEYYGKSLQLAEKNNDAVDILEKACLYRSNYNILCTLGNAYKAEKQYDKAEKAYIKASDMFPTKLYPHYLLANLYFEQKDYLKARAKAKEVLEKKVKVKTRVANEIQEDMKNILDQIELHS